MVDDAPGPQLFPHHPRQGAALGLGQVGDAQLLGIPPFAVGRTQQQARRFDKARLRAAYDFLLDYEYRLKQGRVPQEGCAESALLCLEGLLRGEGACMNP